MSLADSFILKVESQLINGQWFAGRYDMQVLNDLRVWGAKPIDIHANHACYQFVDGSKALWNHEFQDWFLV